MIVVDAACIGVDAGSVRQATNFAAFLRGPASVDFSPNAAGWIGRKVAVSLSFRIVLLVLDSQ